jgi:hypothetical protein
MLMVAIAFAPVVKLILMIAAVNANARKTRLKDLL